MTHLIKCFTAVGYRQQIIEPSAADMGPAKMLRDRGWLDAINQSFKMAQMIEVYLIGATKRQANSVQTQWVVLPYFFQCCECRASRSKIVFTMHLKLGHLRQVFPDLLDMGGTQADACPGGESNSSCCMHGQAPNLLSLLRVTRGQLASHFLASAFGF